MCQFFDFWTDFPGYVALLKIQGAAHTNRTASTMSRLETKGLWEPPGQEKKLTFRSRGWVRKVLYKVYFIYTVHVVAQFHEDQVIQSEVAF